MSVPVPIASAAPRVQMLTVGDEWEGQRLDNFLFRVLKGVPKSHVYRLIRSGQVRINKARAQAETRLATGDQIRVPPLRQSTASATEPTNVEAATPARAFPVLFEDEWLLAIDKPAGVAVHGGSGLRFGVIEQLRAARPQARYLELVHRLDRDTSGILLVAKKRSALTRLQDQFRTRSIGKTYLALVQGHWPERLKVLDVPLHKYLLPDGERRVRATTLDDPDAMRALSLVRVQQRYAPDAPAGLPATSLIEVTIKTGRTHQIRVHTAHSGHPIAGDDKYGDFDWNKRLARHGLTRMFLHAWRLRFEHPASAATLTLECPLETSLAQWCANAIPSSP